MDMRRKGRCVYHIAESDACHCQKYIKNEQEQKEMTLKEESYNV
jgi:ferredoxin-thioredoxin reductase catalytic subunit